MSELEKLTPPIKVVEVNGVAGGKEYTDWLLADESSREFEVMAGIAPVYCQVGNGAIAKNFVRRVNAHDDLVAALARAQSFIALSSSAGAIPVLEQIDAALAKARA